MLSIYQAGFHSPLLPESPALQKVIESGQKGSKVNEFLACFGVFSGKSETKNGKSEIYFGFGAFVVLLSSSFVVAVVVSTECRWSAFVARPAFVPCSPPFARFPAFLYCFAFQICPYLAF